MSNQRVFFDMEAQRFSYKEEGAGVDVYFDDAAQTVRTEVWSDDGYITFKTDTIEDEQEYFARKLKGK